MTTMYFKMLTSWHLSAHKPPVAPQPVDVKRAYRQQQALADLSRRLDAIHLTYTLNH